jgi:hypothetical protein
LRYGKEIGETWKGAGSRRKAVLLVEKVPLSLALLPVQIPVDGLGGLLGILAPAVPNEALNGEGLGVGAHLQVDRLHLLACGADVQVRLLSHGLHLFHGRSSPPAAVSPLPEPSPRLRYPKLYRPYPGSVPVQALGWDSSAACSAITAILRHRSVLTNSPHSPTKTERGGPSATHSRAQVIALFLNGLQSWTDGGGARCAAVPSPRPTAALVPRRRG